MEGDVDGLVLVEGEIEGLTETEGDTLVLGDIDGLTEGEVEGEALVDGDTDTEGETDTEGDIDGLALEEGETDGEVLVLGDTDVLGETLTLGDTEGEALVLGETEGEIEVLGDTEVLGETEAEGLTEGETEGEIDGLTLTEGLTDGLMELEGETDVDGETEVDGDTDVEGDTEALGDTEVLGETDTEGLTDGLALEVSAYCHDANTPTDSVDEPKSMVIVRPVWGEANSVWAPVAVTNVSTVVSKSSVSPVHVALELAAVSPAPIANPAGTSRLTLGSPAVLLSESYAVTLESPVARHAPMAQRRTPVLKVTTMSPVVPVGTLAIARPAVSPLATVFVCWTVIVAETPPILILLIVAAVPALRPIADTMMYLPLSAVPKF